MKIGNPYPNYNEIKQLKEKVATLEESLRNSEKCAERLRIDLDSERRIHRFRWENASKLVKRGFEIVDKGNICDDGFEVLEELSEMFNIKHSRSNVCLEVELSDVPDVVGELDEYSFEIKYNGVDCTGDVTVHEKGTID